jgi:hypothetical protein
MALPEHELIIGWAAIAAFAGLSVGEAQRRADLGELPVHKIGGDVAATPTGLRRWKSNRRPRL